ncbi:hypothetical protein FACS1894219_10250 [Clostridia bacterium]|nr:hypothetical protein FACS1894219_10250 [Clostridia bacterium]
MRSESLRKYDVTFTDIGKDCKDSMPVGNGDIGANVWVEPQKGLMFYIGKTDSWDENSRLLKVGLLQVQLEPNPFNAETPFVQRLCLESGEIRIETSYNSKPVTLRVWIDANNPVIHVESEAETPFVMRVTTHIWRTGNRIMHHTTPAFSHDEEFAFSDPYNRSYQDDTDPAIPMITYADTLKHTKDGIMWYHANCDSCYAHTLIHQELGHFVDKQADPLLFRVFGALVRGKGFTNESDTVLRSEAKTRHHFMVLVKTEEQSDTEHWEKTVCNHMAALLNADQSHLFENHRNWWQRFWDRSYIEIDGGEDAHDVTRGYLLQRYLVACCGRGKHPLKYNGGIFTLPDKYDADYRQWGGGCWFQNTRLIYWPLLAAGDFDMLEPFLNMYLDALPLFRERTRTYFNHSGAHLSEVIYFWGMQPNPDYGWNRENAEFGIATNTYVSRYWQSGLELSYMLLMRYWYTQNSEQFKSRDLLFIGEILHFYDEHYDKDKSSGKMIIYPAASLETWQDVKNPLPEIAGLTCLLDGLLALPEIIADTSQREFWQKLRENIPEIPTAVIDGKRVILPAEEVFDVKKNTETAELYSVFPYPVFHTGSPAEELEMAVNSYTAREIKSNICWRQDNIQAACLGLAEECAEGITERFRTTCEKYKFPAFWGPHFDETPDYDHGGVGQIALQKMLIQSDETTIRLFPAWPKRWNVRFKLHALHNTIVECDYRNGKLQSLAVTPEERRKDVILSEPQ